MDYGTYDPATAQDMLTDVVPSQPQTMLPMARRARLLKLQQQAAEMEGAQPDVSQLQEFARMQGQSGESAMLNALAAQYAGEQFQPVQAQFLKRAMAAQEPMKVGGGMLTPDGKFIRDPFAAQERGLSRLDRLIQAEQGAITAEEAAALRRQEQRDRQEEERRRDERDYANRVEQQQWMRRFQEQGQADRRAGANREARLPFGAVQELSKQAGMAETMGTIADSFKPEFASRLPGVPGVGAAENYLGRAGIGNKDRANWWQNYNEQANIIRNSLFGSALTLTEKAAFESAMISQDMAPEVIKMRLAQQAAAAERAYNKLRDATGSSGYNVSGLPNVRNRPVVSSGNSSPAASGRAGSGLTAEEQAELDRLRAKHRRNQ